MHIIYGLEYLGVIPTDYIDNPIIIMYTLLGGGIALFSNATSIDDYIDIDLVGVMYG